MKSDFLKISVSIIALTTVLAGCKNEALGPVKVADGKGKAISFSVSEQATRTVYGDKDEKNNKWPIYWTDKDVIHIYCDEAEGDVKDAAYEVIPSSIANDSNKGTLKANTNGLRWGSDDGNHNFFAVYPNNTKKAIVRNGIAYFALNYNQVCTINDDPIDGNYIAEPDMQNAYMVANMSTTPVDNVELNFRPIMTTLNITVRGREETNTNTITLTGISIVNNSVNYSRTDDGFFKYDIENNEIIKSDNSEKGTIFIRVKNSKNKDNYYLDLEPGQSVTFTVFLPPVAIDKANQIEVRVHATGETTYSVKVGGEDGNTDANGNPVEYKASSKGSLTLGWFPTKQNGNNWITPLDDDIYVSQLSIPGTHDAATSKVSGLIGSAGRTQDYTVEQQLAMGIRAFDLRPTCTNVGGASYGRNPDLPIHHGVFDCDITLKEIFATFNSFLNDNPGEFIIVTCRWENEGDPHIISKWDTFNQSMTNFLNNATNYPASRQVTFKPDLTIGEMRGKILIIMRPNQGSSPDSYYADKAHTGTTFVTGWPAGSADVRTNAYFKSEYEGSAMCYAVIQDYYEVADTDTKISLIKEELDLSAQSHTNSEYTNTWFINHCSGYSGSAASNTSYSNNAQAVNPRIFEYITGSDKKVGSTGIMMLDFVGKRVSSASNMTVYGDLLPQAIIDNNYKYQMKKRTK